MFKLANLFPKFKRTKVPQKKITFRFFTKIWKNFIRQIPREFRSVMKTHQHFILIGNHGAGKSELVHSIVEQSQNVYPFEVEYIDSEDLQLYLGPKHIIQELSVNVVENRTIKLRRSLIRLWKRLFSKGSPIVVIAHNCWLDTSTNIREVSKFARLIGGKLSLLSELSKGPIKVRVDLTHFDRIDGYLEFAQFLKQHNIIFEIPLATDFQSEVLMQSLSSFREKYLPLMLTTTSASDYQKILGFFSELPKLFPLIEEFLRVLTTGSLATDVHLERLTFSSNQEPYTSFASFDWKQQKGRSIFYRHPMLKHQIAAVAIALVAFVLIFNNYAKDSKQISLYRKGIDSLVFSQPKLFIDELVPQIERVNTFRPQDAYLPFLPRFFKKELRETNDTLSSRIRKHILEPNLRRLMLQEASELKIIYMLGLIHATKDNRLGTHILRHTEAWAKQLELDAKLIHSYIQSTLSLNQNPIEIEYLDKLNISTPLSDVRPLFQYMKEFQSTIDQPVFTGHNFDAMRSHTNELLQTFRYLKEDPHAFVISNLLRETTSSNLKGFEKNIKALKWLEENSDTLESFLLFVYQSCNEIPEVGALNISQFFVKLREVASLTQGEKRTFPFLIEDQTFSFETDRWTTLSATHVIERLIQQYIVANHDTQGDIFFKNTHEISDLVFESFRHEFPYFPKPVVIPGRFTRIAFEKNVRNTAESLLKLLEEMPIIEEDRDRFKKFVQQEVISYAKEYQENYERLYTACDIHSSSLEETKDIMEKILSPSSYLGHFLETIAHHTEVFSDPTTSLIALDEMNHFHFLPRLIQQVKQNKSPFQEYQMVIASALDALSNKGIGMESISPLHPFLTPAANISLSLLKDDPQSYENQIKKTLGDIGVPEAYHSLFLAPIYQVDLIGMKDLTVGIQELWKTTLHPQLADLFEKRPFNPEGVALATLEEVRALTNPQSEFVKIVHDIILPVSISHQGKWMAKQDTELHLSPEIYGAFNRLHKVSQTLWDNQGNPKPLIMTIQSLPFESKQKVYPAPIISYLVTGEETFHNFNQNPMWHSINIEWWKPNSSTVVMELVSKNDSRSYRDEKVTNTLWSFYELLRKAKQSDTRIWEWELESQFNDDVSHIALEFQTNPWEYLQ